MQENGIFSSVPLDLRSVGPLERFESMELLRKMLKILIFVLILFTDMGVHFRGPEPLAVEGCGRWLLRFSVLGHQVFLQSG